MIIGLCKQFHCLPSQLMEEDSDLLSLVLIDHMGTPQEQQYTDIDMEGVEDTYG